MTIAFEWLFACMSRVIMIHEWLFCFEHHESITHACHVRGSSDGLTIRHRSRDKVPQGNKDLA